MNRPHAIALLAASLAAGAALPACGTVRDRQLCADGGCAAGQYCGPAGACLPDTVPPAVASVEVTPGAVRRDGAVVVLVTASDDQAVIGVGAALQLPGAAEVQLTKGSAGWEGRLEVAAAGFPAFRRTVKVRVTARDAAGNEGVGEGSVEVTRALWSRAIGAPLTAAAVAPDGGAVLGVDRDQRQLVKVTPEGEVAWEVTVGDARWQVPHGVVSAPAIGSSVSGAVTVFAGVLDGSLWAASDAGAILSPLVCNTTQPVSSAPAVRADQAVAYFTTAGGALYSTSSTGRCITSDASGSPATGPVADRNGAIFVGREGHLLKYKELESQFSLQWLTAPPPPETGGLVQASMAVDSNSVIWTVSTAGNVNATTDAASTRTLRTLPPGPAGPIILSDGSIVLGDGAGLVHRIDPSTGLDRWTSPSLGANAVTALALTGAEADLIVPSLDGTLHALRSTDGSVVWSARLTSAGALQPGNLQPLAGSGRSIGYFPSSDGTLYAVLLDGALDAAAPWPKAFHDRRNTNNAATPLP